jgi:hypothetical protein
MRGGAVAARRAHNPKVAGSSPAPAIKFSVKAGVEPLTLGSEALLLLLLSFVPCNL